MSEHDLPRHESGSDEPEDESEMHPLEAGIEAAKDGEAVSLEDLFLGDSDA